MSISMVTLIVKMGIELEEWLQNFMINSLKIINDNLKFFKGKFTSLNREFVLYKIADQ